MTTIQDLKNPRYLREVGWFLRYQKCGPYTLGKTFDEERSAFSKFLLEQVLEYCGETPEWIEDKTVVSVGCGCTGDLSRWPAAVKIGIDPLAGIYQQLGMLCPDDPETTPTVYLATDAAKLPLLDGTADLVICRNALDHMLKPEHGVRQIQRILRAGGRLFLTVDIGGSPTPDEPTVFSLEALSELILEHMEIDKLTKGHPPFSGGRDSSVRMLAIRKGAPTEVSEPDKERILQEYLDCLPEEGLENYPSE